MVTYKVFWSGTEYQLMSFPSETLLGVYTQQADESLGMALADIIMDIPERPAQFKIEVDMIK